MPNVLQFESKVDKLNAQLDEQTGKIIADQPLLLPTADSELVQTFISKIEGTYDTLRAKRDTDHAIDLLYIAYNTTPQVEGDIRIAISSIMDKLIKAQQASERTVRNAALVAEKIGKELHVCLPGWQDVKEGGEQEEIKSFVAGDLLELAKSIGQQAIEVRDSLQQIADSYDNVIKDTLDVTDQSELALSAVIKANESLKSDKLEAEARAKELDTLVQDMREQALKFEALASEYKEKADSAQSTSFWASLLRIGAQVLSVVLPIAALATGAGAAPVVVAAAVGNAGRMLANNMASDNDTGQDIEAKEERVKLESKRQQHEQEISQYQAQLETLRQQRESETDESTQGELDVRIAQAEAATTQASADLLEVQQALAAIETALNELENTAANLSAEQKSQVRTLQELQIDMINKSEAYENKRSERESELIKVKALLAGQRTEQETNELSIRSLNLSLNALKRTKEIVEEISFFFKSFSDFMHLIESETKSQVKDYENAGASTVLRSNRLKQLLQSTDAFFVEQSGQWLAVGKVSNTFADTFKEGWSKLNELNGIYITGDKMAEYMETAAARLGEIAEARSTEKAQRLVDLNGYREMIAADIAQA
ncbi:hypothetical protein [Pseudomonas putida]